MQPLPSAPPDGAAVQALMLASRAFVGITVRSLGAVGADVTLAQFRTLVVLAVRGPRRGQDIAAELQINPSTATRMIDRLARKGLVRRARPAGDRRAVELRLTRAGREVVEQVIQRRRAELERIVAATAGLWEPSVTWALTAFAAAAGEMPEQEWWLGWGRNAADQDAE